MTAPANGSAHSVCDDAMRRAEHVLGDVLDRPEAWDIGGGEARDAIRTEVAALKSARALAGARAKQQAAADRPDMGGTTLDLSDAEDARLIRGLLAHALDLDEQGWTKTNGVVLDRARIVRLRKSINAGISKTAHDRCGLERSEEFRALRGADACTGSDDGEVDAE